MPDPSSLLIAFFELPRWAQPTLLIMAAALVLMNAVLGATLRSRRKALRRLEEVTSELAETKTKLVSETRWRVAEEQYIASLSNAQTALPNLNKALT
jgi:membrane protein implicated in regulation of membrane protease activity